MGRRVYLTTVQEGVVNDALTKWENWSEGDRSEEEEEGLRDLWSKLYS